MRQSLVYLDFVENPHFSNPNSDSDNYRNEKDFTILTEVVAKYFRRNWK